jgi:hypothetical protein
VNAFRGYNFTNITCNATNGFGSGIAQVIFTPKSDIIDEFDTSILSSFKKSNSSLSSPLPVISFFTDENIFFNGDSFDVACVDSVDNSAIVWIKFDVSDSMEYIHEGNILYIKNLDANDAGKYTWYESINSFHISLVQSFFIFISEFLDNRDCF